jgi:hypothetical protein
VFHTLSRLFSTFTTFLCPAGWWPLHSQVWRYRLAFFFLEPSAMLHLFLPLSALNVLMHVQGNAVGGQGGRQGFRVESSHGESCMKPRAPPCIAMLSLVVTSSYGTSALLTSSDASDAVGNHAYGGYMH